MKKILASLFILCYIQYGITQSCSDGTYSYNDIAPILDTKCGGCHGSAGGLSVSPYSELLMGGDNCGPGVTPGDASAAASSLIDKTQHSIGGPDSNCGNNMPQGGSPLSATEFLAIETWIVAGAQETCPTTACPPDLNLSGTEMNRIANASGGLISSDQIIAANVVVDYDATTEILLSSSFEVTSPAIFHAFISGCIN